MPVYGHLNLSQPRRRRCLLHGLLPSLALGLAREYIEMYAGAPHTAVRGPQHRRVLARARSAAALP